MSPTNGRLNTSTLVTLANFQPIEAGAGGLARADVAWQHALMAGAFERDLGIPLVVSEGYRDLARQNLKWSQSHRGGALAAYPGTSTHGLAETIDYASAVGYGGTAQSDWMDRHGPEYGFVADVPSERWHRHFAVRPTITAPPEGEDMTPAQWAALNARFDNIEAILAKDNGGGIRGGVNAARATLANIEAILAKDNGGGIRGGVASALAKLAGLTPGGTIGALTDDDLARIAKAVNDEEARRLKS